MAIQASEQTKRETNVQIFESWLNKYNKQENIYTFLDTERIVRSATLENTAVRSSGKVAFS